MLTVSLKAQARSTVTVSFMKIRNVLNVPLEEKSSLEPSDDPGCGRAKCYRDTEQQHRWLHLVTVDPCPSFGLRMKEGWTSSGPRTRSSGLKLPVKLPRYTQVKLQERHNAAASDRPPVDGGRLLRWQGQPMLQRRRRARPLMLRRPDVGLNLWAGI